MKPEEQNADSNSASTSLSPDVTGPDAEHNVSAREPDRRSLANDVEQFLQKGGEIRSVPKDFRADPPKKPENNYGRGSL